MPLAGWRFYRTLTDSNGTSLSSYPTRVILNSVNFDFANPNADGSDLRVYDETASAQSPYWLELWDKPEQQAVIWFAPAATNHTLRLYYGNSGATSSSSFSGVFGSTVGTDFSSSWGNLTTGTSGATARATRLADPTSTSDIRNFQVWRLGETAILSLADMTAAGVTPGNYVGLREWCPVRDGTNSLITVGGKYYVFFGRRSTATADHADTWRAESSTSKTGPWSNFTQIYTPPSPIRIGCPGSVIKIGSTYYMYITYGWDESGTFTPGLSVYYMTSSDLITWSGVTQCLTPGVFNDQTSGAVDNIGNPWVIKCADNVYMMTVEGYKFSNNIWACYGATSSDGITWSALNSGNNLVPKGGAGTWDLNGAANPKCFQTPDGNYLIQYNGSDNGTNWDWQHGYATATARGGSYTKDTLNPVAGRVYGAYGIETSTICYDTDGVTLFNVGQRFATTANTGAFYLLSQERFKGGLLLSRDAPGTGAMADAAIAGQVVSAANFIIEAKSVDTSHRETAATPIILGLWNSASLPTIGTAASLASIRVMEISRNSWDRTGPGDFIVAYWDSGGTRQFWTGSAWSTTTTSIAGTALTDEEVYVQIIFDGTNYSFRGFKSDGTSIFSTSAVASSAIRSMAAGKFAIMGDPFTDAWEVGIFQRYVSLRAYAATEPSISVGSQVSAGILPVPVFFGRTA